ncbi:DHS-like NAD/FAD-binding domain-containing protein [Fomitopsis serialis]|uniref:DHS-like NAD/FAD-binding domain-containing protein n=1 Tax=Fomitopsis serialis TaxID=139415 RepID=UPI0020085794|nr:DHS-like NAD/FAD-binding domain-containing protein [Neoantrodia serialis]KAH9933369.1 DHS-like NAD/FAD-binding domain-containing protein [Neoantrodia serialis]
MDRQPPTEAQGAARSSSDATTSVFGSRFDHIYALQVQGFIEAAEVVDTDPDIIEDLLEDFARAAKLESDVDIDEEDVDVEDTSRNGLTTETQEEPTEWDILLTEAQHAWTNEDVKQMMRTLKEHGMAAYIKAYVIERNVPIPKLLYAFGICLSREKLTQYNTVDDAVRLIQRRQRILILTGAGISVSCGIPDFRSRNGLYASLQESGEYDLDDPQQMFDITYFREKPTGELSEIGYPLSKIYPSNFRPSPCHWFIKAIEDRGKNYTQNIDTLETLAGVQRVLQCHGSFATASCLNCKILLQARPPAKRKARKKRKSSGWDSDQSDEPDRPEFPPGIMKPDITFFGEKLSDEFDRALLEDRQQIDLLIIIGTSLKVSPVSDIIAHLPHSVPQIVLLGNADDVVLHLCRRLSWDLPGPGGRNLTAPSAHSLKKRPLRPGPRATAGWQQVSRVRIFRARMLTSMIKISHVWLFEGAEGGKWVEELARRSVDSPEDESSEEADKTPPRAQDARQKVKRARTK